MSNTEIALLLFDDADKIAAIGEIIGRKISKRDQFEDLNDYEKTFIYIDILENHVSNGGFEEFFWNTSGQFTHEILSAYENIGAEKSLAIIYEALLLFPEIPVPKDINIRREILSSADFNIELWTELEATFSKYEDDVEKLTLHFVRENSSYFD
jgi:DNA-dependent RNA polymerase auxiliary subunit epsilon